MGDLYGFIDMVDVAPGHPMSRELDYGITDTWDDLVRAIDEIAPTTLEGPVHRRLAVMIEIELNGSGGLGAIHDASDYARSDVMSLLYGSGRRVHEFQSYSHISQETEVIFRVIGIRPQEKNQKMAPNRRTTRLNPSATPTSVTDTHTTTSVTNAQIQAMINEGVTAALAARDATRNGDDSHTSGTGVRRPVQVARECTYPDFLKCQPLNFKGTDGVVGLTQWFEKMESVYSISNYTVACQVKFATCTLQGNALTWWNSHVKTTTPEAAHAMPWRTLKKMMTDKYCPRGEIKKLEFEMWNLKTKRSTLGLNVRLTTKESLMTPPGTTRISNQTRDKTLEELMPQEMVTGDHTEGLDLCVPNVTITMMVLGHFKKDCPKWKNNNNRGNQARNAKAQEKVYAMGNVGANPNNNVVTGTILLNNRYASILFDTGADRSFVSTAFSSRIVITPTALDQDYNVELADGRIVGLNTIIQGCTLNLLNHPFNIDLMPVELGSFDVIIGMDWLAKYHAVIVCAEKIVRIPFGDEILIVRGDGSSNKHGTRLNIISCTKAQEYLTKGCHVLLASK
ncbi:putative reverse transcriptase domain-containing protein [Tanacetum coccineum]|uniref:Reverse transcriptase domain-containing protein n=1 Tax=Tanacetum coccineum TaxID=301880 RepID=A0ABQ4X512_9ASTR